MSTKLHILQRDVTQPSSSTISNGISFIPKLPNFSPLLAAQPCKSAIYITCVSLAISLRHCKLEQLNLLQLNSILTDRADRFLDKGNMRARFICVVEASIIYLDIPSWNSNLYPRRKSLWKFSAQLCEGCMDFSIN